MSETAINVLVAVLFIAILAIITVVIVVGGVYLVWVIVTDFMDAIREREEKEGSEE